MERTLLDLAMPTAQPLEALRNPWRLVRFRNDDFFAFVVTARSADVMRKLQRAAVWAVRCRFWNCEIMRAAHVAF